MEDLDPKVRDWAKSLSVKERKEFLAAVIGGHGGDHDRRYPASEHGEGRGSEIPHRLSQRRRHETPLRQPLRHRPEHGGRDYPGHQPAAGRHTFVVSGYGWCGRGVARGPRGMGAHVIICEVDPLRALEAVMDGFQVMPIEKAAPIGDFFCTLTGNINVIRRNTFPTMKDGAIVANSGHFNVELDLTALEKISKGRVMIRDFVEEFTLKDGRRIYVLGEGRLINLAAAEGHPSSVMDMSFANQALSAEYMAKNHEARERRSTRCRRISTRRLPG